MLAALLPSFSTSLSSDETSMEWCRPLCQWIWWPAFDAGSLDLLLNPQENFQHDLLASHNQANWSWAVHSTAKRQGEKHCCRVLRRSALKASWHAHCCFLMVSRDLLSFLFNWGRRLHAWSKCVARLRRNFQNLSMDSVSYKTGLHECRLRIAG